MTKTFRDVTLDEVTAALSDIEHSVHGVMPTATWLEVVRMRINMLRDEPEVNMDKERLARLEADVELLKQAMADMRQAIVDATSHKDLVASVAEVPVPAPGA